MSKFINVLAVTLALLEILLVNAKLNLKSIHGIYDTKKFKKLLKTHTNVLVMFAKDDKSALATVKWAESVAKEMKGQGTLVYVNCGEDKETKKLCKKFKTNPSPLALKHYKDGSFHKDYNRKHNQKSLLNFMRDPTGDAPWEEDTDATNVVHINSEQEFIRVRRKEKGQLLVMFYAPWCGHCKRLKPEYASAATQLKGKAVLAGLNCDKPELMNVREQFNVTGYPTLVYFEKGEEKFRYDGKHSKDGIIEWLANPVAQKQQPEVEEVEWKDEPSDVIHLTNDDFDQKIANSSVLVMFYAPWCGHCKKMKPEYVEAAKTLKDDNVDGILAAVDCTKEREIAKRYDISGFPTVKYFSNGELKYKFDERTADKIVEFMKDPKEPPPPPPPEQPWQETSVEQILHLDDSSFKDSLKKRKHVLVMFYAPWCGHCKRAKPEIEKASQEFIADRKVTFAGIDCTLNHATCDSFKVTGYPTLIYFNYGKKYFNYPGGREAADFVSFMKDPKEGPPPPEPEPEWSDVPSKVNHLTDDSFDTFISKHSSILVMFYAPWCGHCKAMKPAYVEAAEELHEKQAIGVLAAVDCTKNNVIRERYGIKGYPTIKYFSNGTEASQYRDSRTKDKIVKFMINSGKAPKPLETDWSKDTKHVKFLTTDTFDEFAKDKSDMLVMFYAPWCGYCKALKAAYFEAANVLSESMPGAVLAAVDCTVHTSLASKFKITGYPTVKFFRYGEFIVDYEGGRGIDEIISFMKRESKDGIKTPVIDRVKWSELPSSVVHLSSDRIESFLQNETHTLVMFHSPVCRKCLKLRSAYMRAASRLSENIFTLAAMDCNDNSVYCEEKKIGEPPVVRYYYKGQYEETFDVIEASTPDFFVDFLIKKRNAKKDEL